MTDRFRHQVVLVTGAATGIGRHLCAAFAGEGATVALNDLDDVAARSAASSVAAEVGSAGSRVEPFPADVTDVDAVRTLVADVVERHGRLDVVVANAAVSHFGPFLAEAPDLVARVLAVNLFGAYFTAQAGARAMVAGGRGGRIVFITSVAGVQAINGLSAYGATKAGLRMLARTLALELGPYAITVNAVGPGATLTERTMAETDDYEGSWGAVIPGGRVAQVGDVAAAVLFLASAEAAHVTGQTLMVDGGWSSTGPVPPGY